MRRNQRRMNLARPDRLQNIQQSLNTAHADSNENSRRVRISADPPQYDAQQEYSRRFRFVSTLTAEATSYVVTPRLILRTITGTTDVPTASAVRFETVRVWGSDTANLTIEVNDTPDFSDGATHIFQDVGTPGARRASIGVRLARLTRLVWFKGDSTTAIVTIRGDPSETVIVDVSCTVRLVPTAPAVTFGSGEMSSADTVIDASD